MEQANIKTIENYLLSLPDTAAEQIVTFVSYLNFMQVAQRCLSLKTPSVPLRITIQDIALYEREKRNTI